MKRRKVYKLNSHGSPLSPKRYNVEHRYFYVGVLVLTKAISKANHSHRHVSIAIEVVSGNERGPWALLTSRCQRYMETQGKLEALHLSRDENVNIRDQ